MNRAKDYADERMKHKDEWIAPGIGSGLSSAKVAEEIEKAFRAGEAFGAASATTKFPKDSMEIER